MKKFMSAILVITLTLIFVSCSKTKQMTPEIFINIQNDLLSSDQSEAAKEASAKKFGFTAKAYDDFDKLVESDAAMKAKVGELRLKQSEKK